MTYVAIIGDLCSIARITSPVKYSCSRQKSTIKSTVKKAQGPSGGTGGEKMEIVSLFQELSVVRFSQAILRAKGSCKGKVKTHTKSTRKSQRRNCQSG